MSVAEHQVGQQASSAADQCQQHSVLFVTIPCIPIPAGHVQQNEKSMLAGGQAWRFPVGTQLQAKLQFHILGLALPAVRKFGQQKWVGQRERDGTSAWIGEGEEWNWRQLLRV